MDHNIVVRSLVEPSAHGSGIQSEAINLLSLPCALGTHYCGADGPEQAVYIYGIFNQTNEDAAFRTTTGYSALAKQASTRYLMAMPMDGTKRVAESTERTPKCSPTNRSMCGPTSSLLNWVDSEWPSVVPAS